MISISLIESIIVKAEPVGGDVSYQEIEDSRKEVDDEKSN